MIKGKTQIKKIVILSMLFVTIWCGISSVNAEIPQQITLEGVLYDNNLDPLSGDYNVTFVIFDNFTNGSELMNVTNEVTTNSNGHYTTIMTVPNNITFIDQYFVTTCVNGSCFSDRVNLTTNFYAFRAKYTGNLTGNITTNQITDFSNSTYLNRVDNTVSPSNISNTLGIGINDTPFSLDIDLISGVTNMDAKFGSSVPVYLQHNQPMFGANIFYNSSAYRLGKGSSNHWGGALLFNAVNGQWEIYRSEKKGNANDAVNMSTVMKNYESNDILDLGLPGDEWFIPNNLQYSHSGFHAGVANLSVLAPGNSISYAALLYNSSDASQTAPGFFIFDYSKDPLISHGEFSGSGLLLGSAAGGLFTSIAGGKLGIYGNNNSNYAFLVDDTSNYDVKIGSTGLTTAPDLYMYDESGDNVFHVDGTTGNLHTSTGNSINYVYFDTYENVPGNPTYLYLRHSANDSVGIKKETTDTYNLGGIGFQGVSAGGGFFYGSLIQAIQNGSSGATWVPSDLILQSSTDSGFNTNQLVLGTNGNVGIGLRSPSDKLDLNGSALFRFTDGQQNWKLWDSGSGYFTMQSQTSGDGAVAVVIPKDADGTDRVLLSLTTLSSGAQANEESLIFESESSSAFLDVIKTFANGTGVVHNLSIYTGNNTHQLFLTDSGNVGIGIRPDSTHQLEIDGSVGLRGDTNHFLNNITNVSCIEISGETYCNLSLLNETYYSDEVYIHKLLPNNFTLNETKLNNTILALEGSFKWNIDNKSIVNESDYLEVNETWVNSTIKALDTNCSGKGDCPDITYLNYDNPEKNLTIGSGILHLDATTPGNRGLCIGCERTPSQEIEVYSAVGGAGFQATAGTYYIQMGTTDNTYGNLYAYNSTGLEIGYGGDGLFFDTLNRLGLGTNDPIYLLEIFHATPEIRFNVDGGGDLDYTIGAFNGNYEVKNQTNDTIVSTNQDGNVTAQGAMYEMGSNRVCTVANGLCANSFINESFANSTYLRLDASNTPVTEDLGINTSGETLLNITYTTEDGTNYTTLFLTNDGNQSDRALVLDSPNSSSDVYLWIADYGGISIYDDINGEAFGDLVLDRTDNSTRVNTYRNIVLDPDTDDADSTYDYIQVLGQIKLESGHMANQGQLYINSTSSSAFLGLESETGNEGILLRHNGSGKWQIYNNGVAGNDHQLIIYDATGERITIEQGGNYTSYSPKTNFTGDVYVGGFLYGGTSIDVGDDFNMHLNNITNITCIEFSDGNLCNISSVNSTPTINGSGTASYIPKWNDSDTLEDSIIYESNSKIGIGTVSPSSKLQVHGGIYAGTGNLQFNDSTDTVFVAENKTYGINVRHTDSSQDDVVAYWLSHNTNDHAGGMEYNITDERLDILSNGSSVISIDGSQKVGIGTTDPTEELDVRGQMYVGSNNAVRVGGATNNRGGAMLIDNKGGIPTRNGTEIRNAANNYLTLTFDGNVTSDGSMIFPTVYSDTVGGTNRDLYIDNTGKIGYVSSSRRYKENIRNLTNTSWIYDLRPVNFDRINSSVTDEVGLIAEEVEVVNPNIVSYNREIIRTRIINQTTGEAEDIISFNTTNEVETVNYGNPEVITSLIKEMQNLKKENENLTNRLETLERSLTTK